MYKNGNISDSMDMVYMKTCDFTGMKIINYLHMLKPLIIIIMVTSFEYWGAPNPQQSNSLFNGFFPGNARRN